MQNATTPTMTVITTGSSTIILRIGSWQKPIKITKPRTPLSLVKPRKQANAKTMKKRTINIDNYFQRRWSLYDFFGCSSLKFVCDYKGDKSNKPIT
jgi:hypothetical protein